MLKVSIYTIFLLICGYYNSFADVLFSHEYKNFEYMIGEVEGEIDIGYSEEAMYVNKIARFTGDLAKRFLGKVKTGRTTSEFNLKENALYEIDWEKEYIYKLPLETAADPEWYNKRIPNKKEIEEFSKERYDVKEPDISFEFHNEKDIINGYDAKRVTIVLLLETLDKKKNSASVTKIEQTLWLTEDIKGYDMYSEFGDKLSGKTGINPYRLGCMSYLLKNFTKPVDSIKVELAKIKGYPVKNHLRVEGSYINNLNTENEKSTNMVFKDETTILKSVSVPNELDKKKFSAPSHFAEKVVN